MYLTQKTQKTQKCLLPCGLCIFFNGPAEIAEMAEMHVTDN